MWGVTLTAAPARPDGPFDELAQLSTRIAGLGSRGTSALTSRTTDAVRMVSGSLGRAANVALASLPNFTLPGDTSASRRYWQQDITEPFVLEDGRLRVPGGPGLGVTPIPDVLAGVTRSVRTIDRA